MASGWAAATCLVLVALLAPAALAAPAAIGIDLGTTYSCVGVYINGAVQIIQNDQGNRITPSWVAFAADGARLVGEAAKNQAVFNPNNTVYDVKRLIGRQFTDEQVQGDIPHFPFQVVSKGNKPHVHIERKGEGLDLAPEEVSAMVLEKMKATAEDFLGEAVTDAVITVPAYFNDAQRQSTKDAGQIAGLNVLRVLNEPTAAAIAYGLDVKVKSKKVLVFDLGGGTFDVSLLAIDGGDFRVLATAGDTHLGGSDFDQRIMEWLLTRVKLKTNKVWSSPKAIAKLRRAAEQAKVQLSAETQVRIEVEHDGREFTDILTRAKFESLNKDLFKKTAAPIKKVLDDTDTYPSEVRNVVLVGGSTRIPFVRKLVKLMFDGREPETGVNPDEAVAYGAAVQAAVLSGTAMRKKVRLFDVAPLSLGIRTGAGTFAPLIKRNSPIPTTKEKVFTTTKNNQTSVEIAIYEGERALVKDNHFLGKFKLVDIPPGPRGSQKFRVSLSVDEDGILKVDAHHIGHGSIAHSMTIDSDTGRLSEDDIARMLASAEKHRQQDDAVKASNDASMQLEALAFSLKNYITGPQLEGADLTDLEAEIAKVLEAIEDASDFVDLNQAESKEAYEAKTAELRAVSQPLVTSIGEILDALAVAEEQAGEDAPQDEGAAPEDEGDDHDEL